MEEIASPNIGVIHGFFLLVLQNNFKSEWKTKLNINNCMRDCMQARGSRAAGAESRITPPVTVTAPICTEIKKQQLVHDMRQVC